MLITYLEVDDYSKDEESREEAHQVGEVLSVKGLTQCAHLVVAGGQQMKESNDCSLEFSSWIKLQKYTQFGR